jgi:hypothetical protein
MAERRYIQNTGNSDVTLKDADGNVRILAPGEGDYFTAELSARNEDIHDGKLLITDGNSLDGRLALEREEAKTKAIDSLGRYKFQMFGYWAGIWVHLNRIIGDSQPNPFRELVQTARVLRTQITDGPVMSGEGGA